MEYSLLRKTFFDCFKKDRMDFPAAHVLTPAHDSDRGLFYRGKYYSPLIGTIEDDLARREVICVGIARIMSRIKGDMAHGQVYSPEGRFARALVTKRLRGALRRDRYPYSKMEEAVWGEILDRTGVRRVVGIQPSRELCVACHARDIWVADVQHGVIAERHPWYGEKFRGADPREWLPDAFLLWDYGSENVIRKWSEPRGIKTIVTGNRWLARFKHPRPEDGLVQDLVSEFDREAGAIANRPTILVPLSWGETNIPDGFICEDLEQVIRETSNRIRWLIRLHPCQIKGLAEHELPRFRMYFTRTLDGHAQWELPTKAPLPVVLSNVNLVISWSSSVCIEAAQMGVKSALLNPRLRFADQIGDYYEYYRRTGMVELVEEREETILAWISRNIGQKSPPENYTKFDEEYHALLDFLAGDKAPR